MKKILLFLFIFLISNVLATCGEGQIDINSASLEELDKLIGIGPVKAQAIVDTRPFSSIDDLVNVVGIGEVTLTKIKQQNLACISGEETQEEEQEEEIEEEIEEEENAEEEKATKEDVSSEEESEKIESAIKENSSITGEEIKTIILNPLNPKDIKRETDKEQLNKNKPAIYALIIFCILLVLLFGFKKRRNEKNEFK